MDYDLLIIGTEREGIERAISAAQLGARVGIIGELQAVPSIETLRCAANSVAERRVVTMRAFREEVRRFAGEQAHADRLEAERLGIDWIAGKARFTSPNEVQVTGSDGVGLVSSREMIVATGTKSWSPSSFYHDERFVLSIESLLNLDQIPQTSIVVGAGTTGLASANILATLGSEVLVVDEKFNLPEMGGLIGLSTDAFGTVDFAFRLDDEVIGTELRQEMKAAIRLATGRVLTADAVLLAMGREGLTQNLGLEAAGVGLDERGRVWCTDSGKTWASHITVVGDLKSVPRQTPSRIDDLHQIGSLFSRDFSSATEGRKVTVGFNRA